MNSLQMLQYACFGAGVERPNSFSNLNPEQKEVLYALDDTQAEIADLKDWYFLQGIEAIRTYRYRDDVESSGTADVSNAGVVTLASGILTHPTFPRMNLDYDNTGDARKNDVLRGHTINSLQVQIDDPWTRGALVDVSFKLGIDELTLPSTVDKVLWATVDQWDRTTGSVRSRVMTPASYETILEVRSRRGQDGLDVIEPAQPTRYCIAKVSTDGNRNRTMVIDPFPVGNCVILLGTKKKVTKISALASTAQLDFPDKWHLVIVDGAILKFVSNHGQGIPANSRAGRDAPERVRMLQEDYDEGLSEMLNWQKKTQEAFRISPDTEDRLFYQDDTRRTY